VLGLDGLEILGEELGANGLEVADRVDIAIDMDNVLVVKAPQEMVDAVAGVDVAQESVTEALAFSGTLDESGTEYRGLIRRVACGGI